MNVIDELVTLLGFKVSPDAEAKAKKFENLLKGIANTAETVAGTLMGAATAALYFVQKANAASAEIDKLGDLTGQNKQQIQLWSRAVEQMGGSASSAKSDIVNLTRALNPVMPGEYNSGLFMLFGGNYLKRFKDVNSLMGALADKFQKMSPGKAMNWASQIGISPDTLLLLRQGRAGVEQFKKQIGGQMPILSDAELKKAREFEMHWVRIKQIWASAAEKASANLAPSIAKIADRMEKWLEKNQKLIESKLPILLDGVAQGLGIVVRAVGILLGWLEKLLKIWSASKGEM